MNGNLDRSHSLTLAGAACVVDGQDFRIIEGSPDEQLYFVDAAIEKEPTIIE